LLVVNSGCSVSFHDAANGVCARLSTKRSRNTGASDLMIAPVPTATYYCWRPQRLSRRVRRTETGSHLRKTILCRLSRSATGREDDASQRAAPMSGISPKGPVDVELCSHLTVTLPDNAGARREHHPSDHTCIALIGALPTWPYSSKWGHYPLGGLGLVLIILLILVLMGRV
jgi:hypothetical protein